MALAQAIDRGLLVLEAGHTRSEGARDAVERLRQVGDNFPEAILNAVPIRRRERPKHHPRWRKAAW